MQKILLVAITGLLCTPSLEATNKNPAYALIATIQDLLPRVKQYPQVNTDKALKPFEVFAQNSTTKQTKRLLSAIKKIRQELLAKSKRPLTTEQEALFDDAKLFISDGILKKIFGQ